MAYSSGGTLKCKECGREVSNAGRAQYQHYQMHQREKDRGHVSRIAALEAENATLTARAEAADAERDEALLRYQAALLQQRDAEADEEVG
jgi:DNA-directed RNA polymerase subunit M/transcription elongation factor TFIIS